MLKKTTNKSALIFTPSVGGVKQATFRYHRGQFNQETVTVQPIKGHFKEANSARDIEEDMHSGAYLHLPKTAN